MAGPEDRNAAGRIAFTYPDFTRYQLARFANVCGLEMLSVAVGWQVYEITRRPFDLGLVGLAQFFPVILLFLVSGHVADRLDRRRLLVACYGGFAVCSALLLAITLRGGRSVFPIYVVMFLIGVVRSFSGPTGRALLPQLVPEEHFPNAVAWGSTAFQTATILGPALGGLVYAAFHGPAAVYATSVATSVAAMVFAARIRSRTKARPKETTSPRSVLAGLRYIWREKVILGSISLDLFAVLLGGAVALLPVYAREILKTGPWGLGILRSAPGVGAAAMASLLAHHPLRGRVGETMLWCVAGFGVFTIIFGISHNFILSFFALMCAGAVDMVSVIIRGVLVQIATPDEMRGRVNAVDMIFIGTSNEFGEFESGFTAQWLGTVPAVVLGGIGALVVTAIWAWKFPELRKADQFSSMVYRDEGDVRAVL
ncbi:MAG: MFS transporter [Candidatus Acidiferrales bacterium]